MKRFLVILVVAGLWGGLIKYLGGDNYDVPIGATGMFFLLSYLAFGLTRR